MARPRTSPQPEIPGLAARKIAADILDGVLRRKIALDEQLSGKAAHPGLAELADRRVNTFPGGEIRSGELFGSARAVEVGELCVHPGLLSGC